MSKSKEKPISSSDKLQNTLNLIKLSAEIPNLLSGIYKKNWFWSIIGIITAFILWGCIQFEENFELQLNQPTPKNLDK